MARVCKICALPERDAIEARVVSGDSIASIVRSIDGATASSLQRHMRNHVDLRETAGSQEILRATK